MPELYTTDRSRPDAKGSYAFVSLGCPKNLVDSERMLGMLQLDGYQLVDDPRGADFVVVNTCGFIEQAREESFAAIDEMLALKKQGDLRGVIVSGCLAERHQEQKRRVLKMQFQTFLKAFVHIPCQIVRSGRRLIYRVLNWNPWQSVFFRLVDVLRC